MSIKAVVFDIGGVLERVDDASWPEIWLDRWAQRMGLPVGQVLERIAERPFDGDIVTGSVS